MNIDLLLTRNGEAGIVSDKAFKEPVAGVMFDAQSGLLSLEFAEAEALDLNIPVAENTGAILMRILDIHVGVIVGDMISDSRQVPLVLLNDPFGGSNAGRFPVKPRNSVLAFESFMKRCTDAQPVHRSDLGDETRASSVLGSTNAAIVQFAPHLARQKSLEATPNLAHTPQAPGLNMGGGGGGRAAPRAPRPSSPTRDDEDNG